MLRLVVRVELRQRDSFGFPRLPDIEGSRLPKKVARLLHLADSLPYEVRLISLDLPRLLFDPLLRLLLGRLPKLGAATGREARFASCVTCVTCVTYVT